MDKDEFKAYITSILDQSSMYIKDDVSKWDIAGMCMAISFLVSGDILVRSLSMTRDHRETAARQLTAQALIILNEMIDVNKFDRKFYEHGDDFGDDIWWNG